MRREGHANGSRWPAALLRYDDLGRTGRRAVGVIDVMAIHKSEDVRVLLDSPRFVKVGRGVHTAQAP